MPSTRTDREGSRHSRILDFFPPGTVITTARTDVEWVVTEYGAVRLRNQSISSRVKSMISVAHPDFRDELTFSTRKIGWI